MKKPVHINFSALKMEDWDRLRRALWIAFKQEPYGNFMDVYGKENEIIEKIKKAAPEAKVEVFQNINYQAWVQVKK
jgi:hypothetical protein